MYAGETAAPLLLRSSSWRREGNGGADANGTTRNNGNSRNNGVASFWCAKFLSSSSFLYWRHGGADANGPSRNNGLLVPRRRAHQLK